MRKILHFKLQLLEETRTPGAKPGLNASRFDRRLFRSKVVSIDKSRFDRRQESFRSKTRVISIEDCNYCSKCIQLTIYQICLKIFPDTVKRRSLSFFQRYIVRDISLARYFWECSLAH